MKTAHKSLAIVALAIVALTWFSVNVRSTEEEGEREVAENPAAREASRRLQLQDENGQIPPDALRKAYEQKKAMPYLREAWREFLPDSSTVQGIEPDVPFWNSIGPGNFAGRIRSIIIHPANPNTMWVGAVAGGVWKTTNGGVTWSPKTDHLPNLAVNCMAIHPTNRDILYAGTGEGFFNSDQIQGEGIFKTEDGGTTWRYLSLTNNFGWVNRLAISPTNPQIILAGTQWGLFRSTDGGDTWTFPPQLATLGVLDVLFRPNNGAAEPGAPDVVAINCIAGTRAGGAYYSTNNGVTWLPANGLPPSPGRVELAYSRNNPSIVYASIENEARGRLYRSSDGGYSFLHAGASNTGVDYRNNALWVDPTNPNTLIVGGVKLWRSTDGGDTLMKLGNSTTHDDHHIIVEHPSYGTNNNKTVYGGNDGGIYKTNDILAAGEVIWTGLNSNLRITQFYGAAGNVATDTIIGGTQDNFTLRFRPQDGPEDWKLVWGGDGGFCAADQTNPLYFYGEGPNLQIFRSTDGGGKGTIQYIWDGPNGIPKECGGPPGGPPDQPCALFTAPFVLDPNNPNGITMLAGGARLWRSNNVKDSQVSWAEIKPAISSGRYISAIAVAPGNSNLIWVGYDNGSVYYTTNGTAALPSATPSWTQVTGLPQGRQCTRITIGPAPQAAGPDVRGRPVYVTFGGFSVSNVWKTQDNGGTWTDISGVPGSRLPSAPVRSLVISPSRQDTLYVGTQVGIFASSDGGSHWSPGTPGNEGPANVSVDELFWMGTKLVAATHGRGLFTIVPMTP